MLGLMHPKICLVWVLLFYGAVLEGITAVKLPPIYWNSSNPMFAVDREPPSLRVKIRDRLEFHCPYQNEEPYEYHEVYAVPQSDYNMCRRDSNAKIVGVCIRPSLPVKFALVVRRFTAQPNGLEFEPGQIYYFMSTSIGPLEGIQNPRGGLCKSKNMRLRIKVEPEPPPRPDIPLIYHTTPPSRVRPIASKIPRHHTLIPPSAQSQSNRGEPRSSQSVDSGKFSNSQSNDAIPSNSQSNGAKFPNGLTHEDGAMSAFEYQEPKSDNFGVLIFKPALKRRFYNHSHAAYVIYEDYYPAALQSTNPQLAPAQFLILFLLFAVFY